MVTRSRAARVLLAVAALAGAWAFVALVTGGARFQLGTLPISSRNPVRPATLAILLLTGAWWLDRRSLGGLSSRAPRLTGRLARWVAPLAAGAILAVGVAYGGRAAIAADQFGYVSQSILWRQGDLRLHVPLAEQMPWPDAIDTFTPIGYRSVDRRTLVPVYPPGFPLLMASARSISTCAPFLIVPLCAAILTLLTWRLGARLFGPGVGTLGAVMTVASPVVLTWTLTPMSDVPAATFWLGSLLAADRRTMTSAIVGGALSGGAILIRPNLAPLAIAPLLLAVTGRRLRESLAYCAGFVAGLLPFAIFLLWFNDTLYGSPWITGYGDLSRSFSWRHLGANATRYPVWWWTAHGMLGWLFVVNLAWTLPPEIRRRVWTLVGFVVGVAASYAFYLPFDDWTYLRFMLPALPLVMLLSAYGASWWLTPLGQDARTWGLAAIAILAMVQGIHVSRSSGAFNHADVNQRFVDAGLYIDATTEPSAVILSSLHSGSVAFYSGRLTLRYDLLDPAWLDRALDHLRQRGFEPYALLDESEEQAVRERFSAAQSTRALDRTPLAIRPERGGELRLFRLRPSGEAGSTPSEIPRSSRFDCVEPSRRFGVRTESATR